MPTTDTIDQLAAALVAFQAEMPAVTKNSENPFFKSRYADMADVVKEAQPILAKNGLAVSQFVSHNEDRNTLVTYLIHSSGQFITDEMLLMLPKDDPQGQGSAITYARRYAYQSVLGIVADDDDDGQQAANPSSGNRSGSARGGNDNAPACVLCGDSLAGTSAKPHEGGYAHVECIKNATGGSGSGGGGAASRSSADGSGKDAPASTSVPTDSTTVKGAA